MPDVVSVAEIDMAAEVSYSATPLLVDVGLTVSILIVAVLVVSLAPAPSIDQYSTSVLPSLLTDTTAPGV